MAERQILGTESFTRAFPSSNHVPVLLLNQPNVQIARIVKGRIRRFYITVIDGLITRRDQFVIETIVCCPDLRNYLLLAEAFSLQVVPHFPER